mmetsp:Transcript_122280/g.346673  ORF Transcript_122280/g.346673 Transcript_122280/m.346673 type:complete len:471 (+) Transcript_122280:62-1474(+)
MCSVLTGVASSLAAAAASWSLPSRCCSSLAASWSCMSATEPRSSWSDTLLASDVWRHAISSRMFEVPASKWCADIFSKIVSSILLMFLRMETRAASCSDKLIFLSIALSRPAKFSRTPAMAASRWQAVTLSSMPPCRLTRRSLIRARFESSSGLDTQSWSSLWIPWMRPMIVSSCPRTPTCSSSCRCLATWCCCVRVSIRGKLPAIPASTSATRCSSVLLSSGGLLSSGSSGIRARTTSLMFVICSLTWLKATVACCLDSFWPTSRWTSLTCSLRLMRASPSCCLVAFCSTEWCRLAFCCWMPPSTLSSSDSFCATLRSMSVTCPFACSWPRWNTLRRSSIWPVDSWSCMLPRALSSCCSETILPRELCRPATRSWSFVRSPSSSEDLSSTRCSRSLIFFCMSWSSSICSWPRRTSEATTPLTTSCMDSPLSPTSSRSVLSWSRMFTSVASRYFLHTTCSIVPRQLAACS